MLRRWSVVSIGWQYLARSLRCKSAWREFGSQVVAESSLLTCESSELHRFCPLRVMHIVTPRLDTFAIGNFCEYMLITTLSFLLFEKI